MNETTVKVQRGVSDQQVSLPLSFSNFQLSIFVPITYYLKALYRRLRIYHNPLTFNSNYHSVSLSMTSRVIRYVWKLKRPPDDKQARIIMSAAYQTAVKMDPNVTTILVR